MVICGRAPGRADEAAAPAGAWSSAAVVVRSSRWVAMGQPRSSRWPWRRLGHPRRQWLAPRQRVRRQRRRPVVHPQADQDRGAALGDLTPSNPCGDAGRPGPDQIPTALTSYGLRTVDGSCNNLIRRPGELRGGRPAVPPAGDRDVPGRRAQPAGFFARAGPSHPTALQAEARGNVVFDSQPRTVSNLIVDQTSTNPAAIAAAGFPVRSQRDPGRSRAPPTPTRRDPPVVAASRRAACRRTRRSSSRT